MIRRAAAALFAAGALCAPAQVPFLPPMTGGVPSEFSFRNTFAPTGLAWRIEVATAGLFRVTQPELLAAGFSNIVGSELRVTWRTADVAIATSSEGAWGASDSFLFYGWPNDRDATETNVYWLTRAGGGLRIETVNAAPTNGPDAPTHRRTGEYGPNRLFGRFTLPRTNYERWMADVVTKSAAITVLVETVHRDPAAPAVVEVDMLGTSEHATNPDHVTLLSIGNTLVLSNSFDGIALSTARVSFAGNLLSNGFTRVRIQQASAAAQDNVALNRVRITYAASNRPAAGRLGFAAPTGSIVLSSAPWTTAVIAVDATIPWRPLLLTNTALTGATLRFQSSSLATTHVFVAETGAVLSVSALRMTRFRNLSDTNRRADWILVCDPRMRAAAYSLAKHRFRQGLRVVVAPIEDVFNEFGYGIKDPAAIKQFLGFAYHHWRAPAPRFAVLAGEGVYDARNFQNAAGWDDTIPVHLGPSAFEWCAQDGWFATVDGSDYLPDIALGRIASRTSAGISNAVAKIVAFEGAPSNAAWRARALCVADETDFVGTDFANASDLRVATPLLNAGYAVTEVYYKAPGFASSGQVRNAINTSIAAGVATVSYFGHGSFNDWGLSADLFNTNDVASLGNTATAARPYFTMMTCLNGDADNATNECLAELVVEAAGRGGVAAAAAGAASLQEAAEHFALGFYSNVIHGASGTTLGDAMNGAAVALFAVSPNSEELLFYTLFGDPATRIKP